MIQKPYQSGAGVSTAQGAPRLASHKKCQSSGPGAFSLADGGMLDKWH